MLPSLAEFGPSPSKHPVRWLIDAQKSARCLVFFNILMLPSLAEFGPSPSKHPVQWLIDAKKSARCLGFLYILMLPSLTESLRWVPSRCICHLCHRRKGK
jgi:hypothetical protein